MINHRLGDMRANDNLRWQQLDLFRTCVDADEQPDVEINRQAEQRLDMPSVASGGGSERVQH